MTLTAEKRQQYLDEGCCRCPFCGSPRIEGTGRRDYDADWSTNEIACLDCSATWKDVYTITGIHTDEDDEPPAYPLTETETQCAFILKTAAAGSAAASSTSSTPMTAP